MFYFPVYGHALGLSAAAIGSVLGLFAAAAFVVRALIPVLCKAWNEVQILTSAILLSAFAFSIFAFVENIYLLGALAFLLGLGVGCSNPLSMSLLYSLSPDGRVAESIGLLRTAYNFTQLAVPVLFGTIGSALGFAAVFLSSASLLAGGGFLAQKLPLQGRDQNPGGKRA